MQQTIQLCPEVFFKLAFALYSSNPLTLPNKNVKIAEDSQNCFRSFVIASFSRQALASCSESSLPVETSCTISWSFVGK